MTHISENVKQRVRQRAGNRCEYCLCHQDYVMGWMQIDHVIPTVKEGADDEDNLCLACEFCNQYKWTKIDGIDPQSGQWVPLFNPRRQSWTEHFTWSENGVEIVGLTACGRATVIALRLNNALAITARQNWIIAGWHPPVV